MASSRVDSQRSEQRPQDLQHGGPWAYEPGYKQKSERRVVQDALGAQEVCVRYRDCEYQVYGVLCGDQVQQ